MVEKIFQLARKKHSNSNAIARLYDAVQEENLPIRCAHRMNQRFPNLKIPRICCIRPSSALPA